MQEMIRLLLTSLLELLKDKYSVEELKTLIDEKVLDPIENRIAETETKWDDILGMPLIDFIRDFFDIPDND